MGRSVAIEQIDVETGDVVACYHCTFCAHIITGLTEVPIHVASKNFDKNRTFGGYKWRKIKKDKEYPSKPAVTITMIKYNDKKAISYFFNRDVAKKLVQDHLFSRKDVFMEGILD